MAIRTASLHCAMAVWFPAYRQLLECAGALHAASYMSWFQTPSSTAKELGEARLEKRGLDG